LGPIPNPQSPLIEFEKFFILNLNIKNMCLFEVIRSLNVKIIFI
jgi:hypothetical protein